MVRREQSSKEVEISFTSRSGIFYRLLSVSSWTSPSVSSGLCLGEGGKVHFKRTSEWRSRPKNKGAAPLLFPLDVSFAPFIHIFFGIRMGCCSATAALGLANKWLSPLICTSVYVCIPHICVIISFIFYCKSASSIFFRFCYFLIYITLIYTNIFLTVNFVLFPFRKIWFFIIYVSSRSPSVSVSVFVVSNKFCCCFLPASHFWFYWFFFY